MLTDLRGQSSAQSFLWWWEHGEQWRMLFTMQCRERLRLRKRRSQLTFTVRISSVQHKTQSEINHEEVHGEQSHVHLYNCAFSQCLQAHEPIWLLLSHIKACNVEPFLQCSNELNRDRSLVYRGSVSLWSDSLNIATERSLSAEKSPTFFLHGFERYETYYNKVKVENDSLFADWGYLLSGESLPLFVGIGDSSDDWALNASPLTDHISHPPPQRTAHSLLRHFWIFSQLRFQFQA